MKKFLKVVGIVLGGIVLFFAALAFWSVQAISDAQERVTPFMEQSVPLVATWDVNNFEALLTPEMVESAQSEKGQKAFKYLSKVGGLKSFSAPKVLKVSSISDISGTGTDIAIVQVNAEFDNGPGVFTFTLLETDSGYLIQGINLNSDFFLEEGN
ncbi:hypothetical protein [Enterovibrio paralichthyis]|uniref:hypothetical protein n=1 Tax=Enterovibrio paralichthyis TaxID=2853805 RepID=UPI001C47F9C1|nr:hypothetical protein [Enterovibrio paralichthyis]MBV7297085.1 hypothetical protein [Enterovibrio paralichthyis]